MLVYCGDVMNGSEQEALTSPDASMWRGFYFFIGFVIIGGFAIQATSSFPGLQQYNKNSPLILRGSNYETIMKWNKSSLFAALNIMLMEAFK